MLTSYQLFYNPEADAALPDSVADVDAKGSTTGVVGGGRDGLRRDDSPDTLTNGREESKRGGMREKEHVESV
jgi:hypothetical protein